MADQLLEVEIITPSRSVFKGNADMVTLPGAVSEFQVLYNHAPIVSSLVPGLVKIELNGEVNKFAVDGGLVEIRDNYISIISPIADSKETIDVPQLEAKLKENKARILTNISDRELEELHHDIQFNEAQLKITQ